MNNSGHSNKITNIAFIGLGNMGSPMAKNLIKNGYNVSVYDLSDQAQQELAKVGAKTSKSVEDAIEDVHAVITMLPAGQYVKGVYLGEEDAQRLMPNGLLSKLPSSTLVIDCSTISPADSKIVSRAANTLNIDCIDAPVSGGTAGASSGTLTFIVGGQETALERARPILESMGNNVFHAGQAGSGQVAKVCNNMLLGILMSGTAEALNLGIQNGLDPKVLSDIILQSSGRNWALEVYNPYPGVLPEVPSSHNYEGGFMTQHMQKDLNIAVQTAVDMQIDIPMGLQATQLFDEHIKMYKTKDFSSIMVRYDDSVLDTNSD